MKKINKLLRELNTQGEKLDVVALKTGVQTPAVSKMQNKRVEDVSLKKLRAYIEAVGGELDLRITLADGEQISL